MVLVIIVNVVMNEQHAIAEFMGLTYEEKTITAPHGSGGDITYTVYYDDSREVYLKYKHSWDALMPVVEKINKFYDGSRPFVYGKPESVSLTINPDCVKLKSEFWSNPDSVNGNHWERINKKYTFTKHTPLEATYLSVLAFITWFNSFKK